jgi:hypothetical protein
VTSSKTFGITIKTLPECVTAISSKANAEFAGTGIYAADAGEELTQLPATTWQRNHSVLMFRRNLLIKELCKNEKIKVRSILYEENFPDKIFFIQFENISSSGQFYRKKKFVQ